MPDSQQTHAEWQAKERRNAQEAALTWAAEASRIPALRSQVYADEQKGRDAGYLRDVIADERLTVQAQDARSDQARRLAEMWARVAIALAPGQAPADGQPATYDVHLDLDPTTAGEEIQRQLKRMQQRPGSGSV
ncbi:hypothetical protein [Streptomyces sp. NPDC055109]